MDGMLKRLVGLNQILLIVFVVAFLSWAGRRASKGALEIARDLQALSLLKGRERDPVNLCRSTPVQESVDKAVQSGHAGAAYLAVREAFTAYLRASLHFDEQEISGSKRGGGRAYFFVDPQLRQSAEAPSVTCWPLTGAEGPSTSEESRYEGDGAPDSVETIVERSRAFALSRTIAFPTSWSPPTRVEDAVPAACIRKPDPQTPASEPGSGAPEGRSMGPIPTEQPKRLPIERCRLKAVFFRRQQLSLVWQMEFQGQTEGWEETKDLPAKGEILSPNVPFLLYQLAGVEKGWQNRIAEIGKDENRQRILLERYRGISIDSGLQQSQKVYADLVGSVTFFGWNLLPEWFPFFVAGILAAVLFAALVSCRSARTLSIAVEPANLASLESAFFLTLSSPVGTAVTWVLVPALTVALTLETLSSTAATIGAISLGAVDVALGAGACVEFWLRIVKRRPRID
jgi:hypothetical protein